MPFSLTSPRGERSPFFPTRILEVELEQPLPSIAALDPATGTRYGRALVLVRVHTYPLGTMRLQLPDRGLDAADLSEAIWSQFRFEINQHLVHDHLTPVNKLDPAGLPAGRTPRCEVERRDLLARAPFASVVVATHDRTQSLLRTLDTLLALDYPNFEVIVVDNAPSNDDTARAIAQRYGKSDRICYVREPQPGLAIAHNRGLEEVHAPLVAFTDDDVEVDRHWLTHLVRGFDLAPDVACVTGMILPAEMETEAQYLIEQYGYGKGFTRRVYDMGENRPQNALYPYTAGVFGSGANMAFRTAVLRQLGGFDPALGAGSKARGGDDLAAFFRVVTEGYKLVYEPAAILYHWHRREYAALKYQAYGYGVGLMAFLTSALYQRPSVLLDLVRRVPQGMIYASRLRASSKAGDGELGSYPRELVGHERRGMLHGPLAYLVSRWRLRRRTQKERAWQQASAPGRQPTG